jgi:uncharacterized alpha-E superfamily protein
MNAAQWIITSGGVVAAVGVMWRGVAWPVIKWGRRIEKAVTFVEMNMTNNGGTSLRDAIDRIESRLKAVEKKPQSSTVRKKSTTKQA